MSSYMCDNCEKAISNNVEQRKGLEDINNELIMKPCETNAYPRKSCREMLAIALLQAEYMKYLKHEILFKKDSMVQESA